MFELPPSIPLKKRLKRIQRPVWTKNKARLIDRYLFYFVMITKHGTYIDGFAGPQVPSKKGSWAANLVIKSKPRMLRTFYLFDIDPAKVALLRELKAHGKRADPKRRIFVRSGDFNQKIKGVLGQRPIRPAQATFCLLDQRAFECHWDTVKYLAAYKGGQNNKIEIFYLLAVGWLHRSISGVTKSMAKLEHWWGGPGWECTRNMSQDQILEHFCDRFTKLGYRHVVPWPIFKNERDRRVMYYMIHASDHPQAQEQMQRAYHNVVRPKETGKQLDLLLAQAQSIGNGSARS